MSSEMDLMTVAQYAEHRGVSDSYIRRMRRDGKLVCDGKAIRVQASDTLLNDLTHPLRGGDRTPGAESPAAATAGVLSASGGPSVQEAVRRERLARARLAELELGEELNELTRTKGVERAVFTLVRQALNSMMNLPSRLRSQLAAENEPRKVEAMLEDEIRKIAEKMQKDAQALITGAPAEAAPLRQAAD